MSPGNSQTKGSVPEQDRVPCQWRIETQKCGFKQVDNDPISIVER